MQKNKELTPPSPSTLKPMEPLSQEASRHANRIRDIVKQCIREKQEAEKRSETL